MLHAQLVVVGGYQLFRADPDVAFDFPAMSELNQAFDRKGLRVTLTILPALVKFDKAGRDTIVCKEVVATYRNEKLAEQRAASADATQLQIEMSRHDEASSADKVNNMGNDSGPEGRLEAFCGHTDA